MNMKKRFCLFVVAVLLSLGSVHAVPARPGVMRLAQPDGSYVDLCQHGDEYMHFTTTDDGYTVVKDSRGYWVYAALRDGSLIPTAHVAHTADARSAREKSYLSNIDRYQMPEMSARNAQLLREERAAEARTRAARRAQGYDYTKMRGLIILIEFSDQEFSRSDYKELMTDMVNKENYTGYTNLSGRPIAMTGSVHDYYRDNSGGLFTPQFDIVGPYKVSRSKYYPGGGDYNVSQLIRETINAADPDVDFSLYDGENDGIVDMVYVLFAGCGSHITGNDSRLLWPHASTIIGNYGSYLYKDGKRLGRYACSTEMTDSESNPSLDGIGTICHEFSHVLGLPDFYDTDYQRSGGEADHPGDYSILAAGSYLNGGKTPCGYTLFERYVMGFTKPTLIAEEGNFTLDPISECGTGYRINSPSSQEYFLLENRQLDKWDAYIPAPGMIVFRVDSSNVSVWAANKVNANPAHQYFQLLRAGGSVLTTPFPGLAGKTELTHATSPASLKTWSGLNTRMGLRQIEQQSGVITFEAFDTYKLVDLSLPKTFVLSPGQTRRLVAEPTPSYAVYDLTWSTDNSDVAVVNSEGYVTGVGVGTCQVTVTSDNGVTATVQVVVEQQTFVDDIASFKSLSVGEEAVLNLNGAQVLYAYSKDIYIRDASGAIVLNGTGFSLKPGQLLYGPVYGKRGDLNDLPQFVAVSGKTAVTDLKIVEGSEPQPRHVQLHNLTPADYCDMVVVEAAPLVMDNGVYAVSGDRRARLWNAFQIKKISVPSVIEGKFFDVTCIYGTNTVKNVGVVEELKLLESPVEVPAPDAIVSVEADDSGSQVHFNLKGQRVSDSYRGIIVSQGRKTLNR